MSNTLLSNQYTQLSECIGWTIKYLRFVVLSGNNLMVQVSVFALCLCADLTSFLLLCDLLMHEKIEIKCEIIVNIC
jgi:hypothetical protein